VREAVAPPETESAGRVKVLQAQTLRSAIEIAFG
jgi:hypothetical protein